MKKRFPNKDNVLLVNITRLGDMLQATPTIAGLKQENPNCKVTVLVEKQFEAICHSLPYIDQVKSLDLGMTVRSLAREQEGIIDAFEYVTEFVDDLRGQNFDYCLNMSSSAYTALLLRLVGINKNGGWTSDDEGFRVIESDWAKLFATSVFHQNRQYNSLNLVDVFRCSADVEQHPKKLLIKIEQHDSDYCRNLLSEAKFTNAGPLIAVQAGASQEKRQWNPMNFVRLVKELIEKDNARVVLLGTKKELSIINPIVEGVNNSNVFVAAGRTSIPQLAALLKDCALLVTGDTGTMHMAVAAGTPVVSMFLASAYGFETGPYSDGNIVIQPVIGCGPCNPNKPCAGLECHDTISPELVAYLTRARLNGPLSSVPDGIADPSKVLVYQSCFDAQGFCDLRILNSGTFDSLRKYRDAYRKLWLDDLGGYDVSASAPVSGLLSRRGDDLEGLSGVVERSQMGQRLIRELVSLVQNPHSSSKRLGEVSQELTELDRSIEQLGYQHGPLGPVTRMFVFAKENILGTDAVELASQMGRIYSDLERRSVKLNSYVAQS